MGATKSKPIRIVFDIDNKKVLLTNNNKFITDFNLIFEVDYCDVGHIVRKFPKMEWHFPHIDVCLAVSLVREENNDTVAPNIYEGYKWISLEEAKKLMPMNIFDGLILNDGWTFANLNDDQMMKLNLFNNQHKIQRTIFESFPSKRLK